jgi:coenzyme F420-reducing hydrogenase gamma subunit
VAVCKFASCDGCQLSILDCEDELMALAEAVEFVYFPEASRSMSKGPYDIAFVEGSITTRADAKRIQEVRKNTRILVTIGACATAGGIQALKNYADVGHYVKTVYAKPEFVETLDRSTPIHNHVFVDYEVRGCPVSKEQLIDLVCALLVGRRPVMPTYPVCMECKRNGNVCVMVATGEPCLGPVTRAGCGAICPSFNRGCYGCFGPSETPNTAALSEQLAKSEVSKADILRMYRSFNSYAEPFHEAGQAHE